MSRMSKVDHLNKVSTELQRVEKSLVKLRLFNSLIQVRGLLHIVIEDIQPTGQG